MTLKTSEPTTAIEAWSVDVTPASHALVVDDVVTIYTVADGKLTLRAYDAADGAPLWHHQAAPGGVRPSESEITPVTALTDPDDEESAIAVVYVAPPESDAEQTFDVPTRLVSVDPLTGETVSRSESVSLASSPRFCEVVTGVCVDVWTAPRGYATRMRLDVATGELSEVDSAVNGQADRAGVGVRITDDDMKLVRVVDGKDTWVHSGHELLDGAPAGDIRGASNSEEGWSYLTIRPGAIYRRGDTITTDLASHMGVLLDLESGEVRWTGKSYAPCPESVYSIAVRCRASGRQTIAADGEFTYSGLDLTLEGFDSQTGRTTWELPLGDDGTLLADELPYTLDEQTLVKTAQGIHALNPETGELTSVDAGTYLCDVTPAFHLRLPWQTTVDGERDWHGTDRHRSCDADGDFVEEAPGIEALQSAGLSAAGLRVVVLQDQLAAYRLK